jgi:hypothetical protein
MGGGAAGIADALRKLEVADAAPRDWTTTDEALLMKPQRAVSASTEAGDRAQDKASGEGRSRYHVEAIDASDHSRGWKVVERDPRDHTNVTAFAR